METSFAQDAERKLGMDQQAIRKVQQNQKIMLGMICKGGELTV